MPRKFLLFLVVALVAVGIARADEAVRDAQTRLKDGGFYFGEINGEYTSETSTAVSRYQIRNGLRITAQIDAETAKSLGLEQTVDQGAKASSDAETWRRLRKLDRDFLTKLNDGKIRAPAPPAPVKQAERQTSPPPSPSMGGAETETRRLVLSPERLRDYVAAFVLAGLDPNVGSELEFFADRVRYYDQGTIPREKIQRDLQRYNQRWPERNFRLAGEIEVEPQNDSTLVVSFPLRYELRRAGKRASGVVRKTITLQVVGEELEIVAVNEN